MKTPARMLLQASSTTRPMSHLRNLAKVSSFRGARSIWLTGTSRTWLLARTPRTMFTTSRRSSVEPNQHHQEKTTSSGGFEPSQFEASPHDDIGRARVVYPIMVSIGVCLLAYSVYNIYKVVTMWPEVLRDDLRNGIKHRNKRNLPLSIQHLQHAWETAKTLPLNTLGTDPLLKTTGIAIILAGALEDDGQKEEAYKIYQEALWQLQSTHLNLPPPAADAPLQPDLGGMENLKLLTPSERMRAAALSHKLGCLASELKKPEEEEEKWLTWSVNAILMAVMEAPAGSEGVVPPRTGNLRLMGGDMGLPSWAKDHDIAAPFEALGTFYSDRGNSSYALPLYLQAVSILIPPPPLETSPEDRCRGARLMRDISLFIAMGGGPEAIAHATSWAQKGLDVASTARQSKKGKGKVECDSAYVVLLYHLAWMQIISSEYDKGRESFEIVLKESKAMKMKSVARHAQEQLDKLDSEKRRSNEDKTVLTD